MIDRLEALGLVVRNVSPADRKARLLTPTENGLETLADVVPLMLRSQDRLLEPLSSADRDEFMRLMKILIETNAELSNIPAKE